MTLPLPLLVAAACADWLITLRPLQTIARLFEVETGQLEKAVAGDLAPLTSRGQLQSALQSLENRPELLPHKTHLARLEHQLALLARQFDRAEADVERIQNRPEGCDFNELRKAEVFANRLHQQTVRLLKEIQKTQLLIDRASNEPAANDPATMTGKSPARARKTAAPLAETAPMTDVECDAPQPVEPTTASQDAPAINPVPATTECGSFAPPTPEEYRHCIVKNRQRIKNTPAKDRQALIQRLVEEYRARQGKTAVKTAPKTAA